MSTFIKIPGVNPPSTRPRVDLVDPAIPENGVLYLYDATHPGGRWSSGAASGLSLPNVASASALKMTGNALHSTLEFAGSSMRTTRSGKSGLYVIPDTDIPIPDGNFARFNVPAALAEFIFKNPTHSYYVSQWTRSARHIGGAGTPPFTALIASSSSSYLADLYRNNSGTGTYPNPGLGAESLLGSRNSPVVNGGTNLNNLGVSGWTGALPASASAIQTFPFMLGRTGPVVSPLQQPALIVYRCYMEDLTVSKRTYAQADAADFARFTEEVLTSGGRYYGDTYTAP